MPSKGIDTWTWGINDPNWIASMNSTPTPLNGETTTLVHIEIDSSDLPPTQFTGEFLIEAIENGNTILQRTNYISTLTGNLQDGSNMTNLSQMQTVIGTNMVVSYGFYDAGSGIAGLPSSDRFWIAYSQLQSTWMGTLAPASSEAAQQPLNSWVLPSAHDAGMNSTTNVMTLLHSAKNVATVIAALIAAIPIVGTAVAAIGGAVLAVNGENVITALAITQKDSLTTMLKMGARYFEFRPAHISTYFDDTSVLPDELYFTHWTIPGQSFASWLTEAVQFLTANPTEVVVVQIRSDGVDSSCTFATTAEVDTYVSTALQGSDIVRGGLDDLATSIDGLRNANKRLIVLTEVAQYSTYGGGNATLDGNNIVNEFTQFLTDASKEEPNNKIAVWQCQATSTSIKEVAVYCATFANGATSSLLCTKPSCDALTLPWLENNVYPTMPTTILQVIMNDFFDGWTSMVAIALSQKYLQKAIQENRK